MWLEATKTMAAVKGGPVYTLVSKSLKDADLDSDFGWFSTLYHMAKL